MSRGLFITGTDTGVGKTLISCALLRALSRRGHRMGVYKPSETGCPRNQAGELVGEDCARLQGAAALQQDMASVSTALFEIPAAPLVSADAVGASIEVAALLRDAARVAADFDAVVVEGAGGLMVPIAPDYLFADFAQALGFPVLLVVGSKLGCLNHALLTLAELERRGVPIAGTVLNDIQAPAQSAEFAHAVASNGETLSRFSAVPSRGHFRWSEGAARADDFDALAQQAEEQLDVSGLAQRLGLSALV